MKRGLFLIFLAAGAFPGAAAGVEDCNGNNINDRLDLLPVIGFQPPLNLPARQWPSRVISSDLDGDGDPDLAVSTYAGVTLYLNDGRGKFPRTRQINLISNGAADSVVAADLDGDGDMDLAAVQYNFNKVAVLLNDGDGVFEINMIEAGRAPIDIGAEDLDGDGDLDLAVLNFGNSLSIYINEGDAQFEPQVQHVVGVGLADCRPLALAIADLDGDRDPDLAVASNAISAGTNLVFVFLNEGDASFRPPVQYDVGEQIPRSVAAVDLNGGGYKDLVVAVSGDVFVFYNFGDGTFQSPQVFPAGPPYDVYFVAAADIDADGDEDVLTANCASEPHLAILRNDGGGFLGDPEQLKAGECPRSVAAVDLDLDGSLDLVAANGNSNNVSVIFHGTTPPFSRDLNGNGIPDECETMGTPFHRGDPFADGREDVTDSVFLLQFLFLAGAAPGCMESGDFDNDGEILLNDPIAVLIYLFQAGPPPASPGPHTAPCGPDPDAPGSPGDLGCASYDLCR